MALRVVGRSRLREPRLLNKDHSGPNHSRIVLVYFVYTFHDHLVTGAQSADDLTHTPFTIFIERLSVPRIRSSLRLQFLANRGEYLEAERARNERVIFRLSEEDPKLAIPQRIGACYRSLWRNRGQRRRCCSHYGCNWRWCGRGRWCGRRGCRRWRRHWAIAHGHSHSHAYAEYDCAA